MKFLFTIISAIFFWMAHDSLAATAHVWGEEAEQDLKRLGVLKGVIKSYVSQGIPSDPCADLKLTEDKKHFIQFLNGVAANVDHQELSKEIGQIAALAYSYLFNAGYLEESRTYLPTIQALLKRRLITNIEDLNYPRTDYFMTIVEVKPGSHAVVSKGTIPRFNNITGAKMPDQFRNLLVGAGHAVPNPNFPPASWFTIDFDPDIGPNLIGDINDPKVLGVLPDNHYDQIIFEYISWEQWRVPGTGKNLESILKNLERIVTPNGCVGMLSNSLPPTGASVEATIRGEISFIRPYIERAGFIVHYAGSLRSSSMKKGVKKPHAAPSIFFSKAAAAPEKSTENYMEIKELLKETRPFLPEVLSKDRKVDAKKVKKGKKGRKARKNCGRG